MRNAPTNPSNSPLEDAGLRYADTTAAGFSRRRAGRGFAYRDADGGLIKTPDHLTRIRALVIPPAWAKVWICPDESGHIQAFGFDQKGRKQYIYHPKFREVRDGSKFEHVLAFAGALPRLRERVAADMARPGLPRAKVLASLVRLLETTLIRVGGAAYAKTNKSYGLTTLLNRHVRIEGAEVRFHFKGKSGKTWRLGLRDRRIAAVIKRCQDLPGQNLFQYLDADGHHQVVSSADVNAYLKAAAGADITAKDFRTWIGTVLATQALSRLDPPRTQTAAQRNLRAVVVQVAERLGNTPTICRKSYIHPEVIAAYLEGDSLAVIRRAGSDSESAGAPGDWAKVEAAVLSLLRRRLKRLRDASPSCAA